MPSPNIFVSILRFDKGPSSSKLHQLSVLSLVQDGNPSITTKSFNFPKPLGIEVISVPLMLSNLKFWSIKMLSGS